MNSDQEIAEKVSQQIKLQAEFDKLGEKQEFLPIFINRLLIPAVVLFLYSYFYPAAGNIFYLILIFVLGPFLVSVISAEIQNKANKRMNILYELLKLEKSKKNNSDSIQ